MLSVGTTPNGSLFYLYLPNWHANIAKYDACLFNLRLCCPKYKYLIFVSFWSISLRVGPLWLGHMRAWLHLAGSKHNLTCPLSTGTNTKFCTILLSHPCLVVWWCPAAVATIILPWMFFIMHRLHASGAWLGFVLWLCLQWEHAIKTSNSHENIFEISM